jgi:uncharacterized protein YndB with AHSA1/START domain
LVLAVEVDAPAEMTWEALTDWARQSEWMLGTTVRGTGQTNGQAVGDGIQAFTGIGRLGFTDTMEITEWDPPRRCVVVHTGSVVRGTGEFEVEPLPRDRSRVIWSEHLELPLGALGVAGWTVVKPAFARGVERSLRQFADQVAAERSGASAVRRLRVG